MTSRLLAAALLLLALAAGCGDSPAAPSAVASGDPYAGYPPCQEPPPAQDVEAVAGLVLPVDAAVQSSTVSGPLTTVNAYVEATPLAIRSELEQHPEATVVHAEDEVFEAELLLELDGRRSLVKAVSVCDGSSQIVAVVSDGDPSALPSPGGTQP